MHIVIDARYINSGTGTYAVKLLDYLQDIDITNRYTILVPQKDISYWQPHNKNFVCKGVNVPMYSFAEQSTLHHILSELKPDLVHFGMPQQPVLYKGKKVTTIFDLTLLRTYNSDKNWLVYHFKQYIGKFVFKHAIQTSEKILTISQHSKNEILTFFHTAPDHIVVTYPSAERHIGKLEPYKLPYKKFIMYVGQQPDYKNLRRLAAAHQRLLTKHPDLGLVFVGRMNEDTKRNQHYYKKCGYKNIHFTGFIPDSQRDWLFTQAAAYIFPSLMEGFGLPPLEAMAYGTPVVSSSASCMPEVLGDAAEYFNPMDTNDMAAAIERVITNPILQEQMIERGFSQVKKYSWHRMAEETHAVYMAALKS